MAFRVSQFGRFGTEVRTLVGFNLSPAATPSEIDFHSASLLGNDTPAVKTNKNSAHWLCQRGYPEQADIKYASWRKTIFPELVFDAPQIVLLHSSNPNEPVCIHDFVPSTLHRPLVGWFVHNTMTAFDLDGVAALTNVRTDKPGKLVPDYWRPKGTSDDNPIGQEVKIIWILDQDGEILVAPEQLGHVKHSSLAAGCSVWAAGEMGFEHGKVRVVNFRSGHYLNRMRIVGYKNVLKSFVETVFRQYNEHFMDSNGLSGTFEVDDT